MGPFQTREQAEIIQNIWTYQSRGPMPRAGYAFAIAKHFSIPLGLDAKALTGPLKHWDVILLQDCVYLVRKDASTHSDIAHVVNESTEPSQDHSIIDAAQLEEILKNRNFFKIKIKV